jgi:hypothetical protein
MTLWSPVPYACCKPHFVIPDLITQTVVVVVVVVIVVIIVVVVVVVPSFFPSIRVWARKNHPQQSVSRCIPCLSILRVRSILFWILLVQCILKRTASVV